MKGGIWTLKERSKWTTTFRKRKIDQAWKICYELATQIDVCMWQRARRHIPDDEMHTLKSRLTKLLL